MPKIIYTDRAIANHFSDGTIEMHKDLKLPEWKNLHDKILNHEKDHDFSKGWWHNVKVDFFGFVGAGGLLQFMLPRPKTWIQLLPFYYTKKRGIIFDKNLLLFYSIIASAVILAIKFFMGGK